MKLFLPILLTFTSLLFSFSLKGAKGIEEALFTWTGSPSTTLHVIWLVKDKDPTRHVIEVEIKDNVRTYRAINHDKKVFDEFVDKRDAD